MKKKPSVEAFKSNVNIRLFKIFQHGRGDRTRTYDLMLPKQARVEEEVSEISLVADLSSGVRF